MKKTILFLFISILILTACAPKASESMAYPEGKSVVSNETTNYAMDMPAPAAVAPMEEGMYDEQGGGGYSSGVSAAEVDRLVIKNANLSIIVEDPGASMDHIAALADEMGGWVVTSNLYKTTTSEGVEIPQANINIRVPADQLNDALEKIKSEVDDPEEDIRSENVSGEDVTSTYTDLKSRLTNLEQAEASLREIMASATKTEDVLAVFNQLTQVRSDIEVIKGQMKYYEESAHFSSINVELISQASIKPLTVSGWQPVGVVRDALQALINFGKFLVNTLIWFVILVLPILVVLYIGVRILIWIIKKLFPGKKKPAPVVPAQAEPSTTVEEKKEK